MEPRAYERQGQGLHGLVGKRTQVPMSRAPMSTNWSYRVPLRLLFAIPVIGAVLVAIVGGLFRAGVQWVGTPPPSWLGAAVSHHAFLMIGVFMGTVIGIERAVAVRHVAAYTAPVGSGMAGMSLLGGHLEAALWLAAAGSVAFVLVNIVVVIRQRAPHTALLLVAALAWAAASLLHLAGWHTGAVIPLWFCLLVLTIAAERLEMTRLMRRRKGAAALLYSLVATLMASAVATGFWPIAGGIAYGAALAGLAVWLLVCDIARRTVIAQGLSRYMALCLLSGYFWLLLAGLAWSAMSAGWIGFRDTALHALALGFVFSMMLGHAPVILPAIARVKVLFGWVFYVPLALLHLSLAWRLFAGQFHAQALATGAIGNALALALFAATMVGGALAWRIRFSSPTASSRHGPPSH